MTDTKQPRPTLSPRYNAVAVDNAIRSSRKRISGKEAKLIHALLKGRG